MLNKSVIGKLWVSIVLLVLVVLILLSFGLSSLLENFYYSQISADLIKTGQELIDIIRTEDDPRDLNYELTLLGHFIDSHIIIVDKKGFVQACDAMLGLPTGYFFKSDELSKAFAGEIITKRGHHQHFDVPMLSVAIPEYIDGKVERILMMFKPVAPITNTINSMRWLIVYSAIIAIILATIISFFLSRTLSRPLLQMNKAANEMAKGNFDHKVTVQTNDEVGLLGASLNNLSEQLKNKINELSHEKAKLEKVLEKERAIEQMRRDFITNVSHELRTPLSLIQGYSEAIIDGIAHDKDEQNRYAKIICKETARLKNMVSELFDISRLQTGNFTLAITRVDIGNLINSIKEKYETVVLNKGLDFETRIENGLPKINADYDRLQQVLINLLENALNHTPEGRIEINAYANNKQQVCVEVADSGCGIPREDLELVWERFHKADKSRNRNKGGAGLGLAIVKSIVEAHGGNVWVKSQEGEGSVFGFCLPVNDNNGE